MKRFSNAKMRELENAISAIEAAIKKDEDAKERKARQQLDRILEFDYPEAGKDLAELAKNPDFSLSTGDSGWVVDALIDGKISEEDFMKVVPGCYFDLDSEERLTQAVADGRLSLELFYQLLDSSKQLHSHLLFASSTNPIFQAALDKKLPAEVFSVAIEKDCVTWENQSVIAKAYLLGLISIKDMEKLINDNGFHFTLKKEQEIIDAIVKEKKSVDLLMPFLGENYCLQIEARKLLIAYVTEGELPFSLILQQPSRGEYWYEEAVLPVYEAVQQGKLSVDMLKELVKLGGEFFSEFTWWKLFKSGYDFCVIPYLKEFYPELLFKVQ